MSLKDEHFTVQAGGDAFESDIRKIVESETIGEITKDITRFDVHCVKEAKNYTTREALCMLAEPIIAGRIYDAMEEKSAIYVREAFDKATLL